MNARLVVELTPEEWEEYDEKDFHSLTTGVTILELRQGVLTEERPIGFLSVRFSASFIKEGEWDPRKFETPGPGPWLEVWPAKEERSS